VECKNPTWLVVVVVVKHDAVYNIVDRRRITIDDFVDGLENMRC